MMTLTVSILSNHLHHLVPILLQVILLMNSIHLLQTEQKVLIIHTHTIITHIHKNPNSIFHLIIHHTKLRLTPILTSNHIQVLRRAVFRLSHLSIIPTIKALMHPTLNNHLQQQAILRLPNFSQAVEMEVPQYQLLVLEKHTSMTTATSHHLRKLQRHTRLLDLQ